MVSVNRRLVFPSSHLEPRGWTVLTVDRADAAPSANANDGSLTHHVLRAWLRSTIIGPLDIVCELNRPHLSATMSPRYRTYGLGIIYLRVRRAIDTSLPPRLLCLKYGISPPQIHIETPQALPSTPHHSTSSEVNLYLLPILQPPHVT